MLFDNLDIFSEDIAIITESKNYSYKELINYCDKLNKNLRKDDLIFVLCKNNFESILGYISFLRKKAKIALLEDTINIKFLEKLIKIYLPKYIYMDKEYFLKEKNCLFSEFKIVSQSEDYVLLKAEYQSEYEINEDLAMLLTTSGSTGTPKFVRISYQNILSNTLSIIKYLNIKNTDRAITTMPMSYSYGLSIINTHLYTGATIILTEKSIIQKDFWSLLRSNNVTTFGGVPFTFEMLKRLKFQNMDLSALRYITQAGGNLNKELVKEFALICKDKNIDFIVMYGQTEASPRISYLPPKFAYSKAGSIGIAIPGGKLILEDKEGKKINENDKAGELVYYGKNVALGYSENFEDLSKKDENKGILHTGDIARKDKDNFFYIEGRKKRFLKIFGKRINLDELQKILIDKGLESVCVGKDDNLKVYITDIKKKEDAEKLLINLMNLNKKGFKIFELKNIPRNESNKIIYSKIEEKNE